MMKENEGVRERKEMDKEKQNKKIKDTDGERSGEENE